MLQQARHRPNATPLEQLPVNCNRFAPTTTHFLYMDEANPTKVKHWYRAVGPVSFGGKARHAGTLSLIPRRAVRRCASA